MTTTAAENKPGTNSDPPNIVVCSDGTWNRGGAVNPTNVWRTFTVVSPDNQIKFHDNGVGTEGFRILQYIGGAFGWGISQNLKELLAFIIQSYQPGSKIFLFGFSRGAFTVRVVANIICMYGIPNKKGLRTSEQVEDVASEMLRCYKDEKSTIWHADQMAPKKGLEYLAKHSNVSRFQTKYDCYLSNDKDAQPYSKRGQARDSEGKVQHLVHFLGCWDTVEALGVPFEPLKRVAIHYFPLRFKDTIPNAKIKTVCHALSLDDERRSFHPLCFTDVNAAGQTIHQTWFPGNHCHVGGGYSRDQMAMVPLKWMLDHARREKLILNEEQLEDLISTQFTHGQMPSSRSGGNFFYGYHPRRMDESQSQGPWSIHISTFQRLGSQIQIYLPTATVFHKSRIDSKTDSDQAIEIDGGDTHLDFGFDDEQLYIPGSVSLGDIETFNEKMNDLNNRAIWFGQVLWFVCLAVVVAAVVFGFVNSGSKSRSEVVPLPSAIYGVEKSMIDTATMLMPQFVSDNVFQGFLNRPGSLAIWMLAGMILILICRRNRHLVEQQAFDAWSNTGAIVFKIRSGQEAAERGPDKSSTMDEAATVRRFVSDAWRMCVLKPTDGILKLIHHVVPVFRRVLIFVGGAMGSLTAKLFRSSMFSLFVAVAAIVVLLLIGSVLLDHSWNYSRITQTGRTNARTLEVDQSHISIKPFDAKEIAFSSDVWVEKGQCYDIRLMPESFDHEIRDPESVANDEFGWQDKNIPASPDGFDDQSKGNSPMFWLRKYPNQPMFKVLGRIEPDGREAFEVGVGKRFRAKADGLLVLFVNDVKGFYSNNSGRAVCRVTRLPDDTQDCSD